jgi:hypothetical protein
MIHYDLRCAKDHVFDAWFRDSAAYDELARQRKLSCPLCGSKKVAKAPMAPRISKSVGETAAPAAVAAAEASGVGPIPVVSGSQGGARMMAMMQDQREMLEALKQHVEANCDYVGPDFAEEARKIHYGETAKRGIYGEATDEEASALADEGIEVQSLPWPQRSDA